MSLSRHSGSQPGAICPSGNTGNGWRYLLSSNFHNLRVGLLLVSSGWRPRMILRTFQCTGQCPRRRMMWPQMPAVRRMRPQQGLSVQGSGSQSFPRSHSPKIPHVSRRWNLCFQGELIKHSIRALWEKVGWGVHSHGGPGVRQWQARAALCLHLEGRQLNFPSSAQRRSCQPRAGPAPAPGQRTVITPHWLSAGQLVNKKTSYEKHKKGIKVVWSVVRNGLLEYSKPSPKWTADANN